MPLIVIIVIILIVFFVRRSKKSKQTQTPASVGNPADLPDTLGELRKMQKKSRKNDVIYQCRRKICEIGMRLYQEGKLVAQPGDENDVSTLLQEMVSLIHDSHMYVYFPTDVEFDFRCWQAVAEIMDDFRIRAEKEPELDKKLELPYADLGEYGFSNLARFYTEGIVCPRDPEKARLRWRQYIVYQQGMKKEIPGKAISGLMEIPAPGEQGRQEILKWIAAMYSLGAIKLLKGEIARNCWAQTHQQCAELLFQLNWDVIGGTDIPAMLEEYRKGTEAGNAYAQYKLGVFYYNGSFLKEDEEKGMALIEQAAEQNLYVAVEWMSNHYYWLAHPSAGDYGNTTKQQIKEYEKASDKWSKRADQVLATVEAAFKDSFGTYVKNSAGLETQGEGKVTQPGSTGGEDVYTGKNGLTDSESPFTILSLPDVITGPYNVTYRKVSVSANSADYISDHGESATIHVSDISPSGGSATTSAGYFHW